MPLALNNIRSVDGSSGSLDKDLAFAGGGSSDFSKLHHLGSTIAVQDNCFHDVTRVGCNNARDNANCKVVAA